MGALKLVNTEPRGLILFKFHCFGVLGFWGEDKLVVSRARKIQRFLSQPFFVAEVFTGSPGKLVDLQSTIKGFDAICKGHYDHLPESAFYMVGTIEEAVAKAEKMAKEAAA